MNVRIFIPLFSLLFISVTATAQDDKLNFPDKQAIIINNVPNYIELSGFSFKNEYERSRFRLNTSLNWKNKSDKPITAFELVLLRYDPFNRPIRSGGRWLVTGRDSGNWSPLMPGASSGDGTLGFDTEPVLTSVVFVRAIRFSDGQVWMSDQHSVEKLIKQKLPLLKELGDLSPSPQDSSKK